MIVFILRQLGSLAVFLFGQIRSRAIKPPTRMFVGYAPVWGSPLAGRLANLRGVNAVNIAYGFPEYNNTIGWGPQQSPDRDSMVQAIADLNAKKIPVLISLGGENCTRNDWENITDPVAFARNVRIFIDEMGFSGVDLDYQVYESDHSPVIPIIKALREALPQPKYLLTYSGWPNIKISETVIRESRDALDWVNACCYVINTTPEYEPRDMIERYVELLQNEGKVVFGFRVERRPGEPVMTVEQGVEFSEYVVERSLGGVMLWNLSDARTSEFIEAIEPILFPAGARRELKPRRRR